MIAKQSPSKIKSALSESAHTLAAKREAMMEARKAQNAAMKRKGKKAGGFNPLLPEELEYFEAWAKHKGLEAASAVEDFLVHIKEALGEEAVPYFRHHLSQLHPKPVEPKPVAGGFNPLLPEELEYFEAWAKHKGLEAASAVEDFLVHAKEVWGEEAVPYFRHHLSQLHPKPVTIQCERNLQKVPNFGEMYGQHIEPAGRDMVEAGDKASEGWERGVITFNRPLLIEFGGGYRDPDNWKNVLSARYGGKTGKELSRAIVADGYDGIITYDKHGRQEIVSLLPDGDAAKGTVAAPVNSNVIRPLECSPFGRTGLYYTAMEKSSRVGIGGCCLLAQNAA